MVYDTHGAKILKHRIYQQCIASKFSYLNFLKLVDLASAAVKDDCKDYFVQLDYSFLPFDKRDMNSQ